MVGECVGIGSLKFLGVSPEPVFRRPIVKRQRIADRNQSRLRRCRRGVLHWREEGRSGADRGQTIDMGRKAGRPGSGRFSPMRVGEGKPTSSYWLDLIELIEREVVVAKKRKAVTTIVTFTTQSPADHLGEIVVRLEGGNGAEIGEEFPPHGRDIVLPIEGELGLDAGVARGYRVVVKLLKDRPHARKVGTVGKSQSEPERR